MARVITVTGGKEHVGATFVSANLAVCLSARGFRTCLLFADPDISEENSPLPVEASGNIDRFLIGDAEVEDIRFPYREHLDVIFAGDAFSPDKAIEQDQAKRICDAFAGQPEYDYVVIDTLAVPSQSTISFCRAASQSILVFTPEPPAISGAYALVKALGANGFTGRLFSVVNKNKNGKIAELAVSKLNQSLAKRFTIEVSCLATISLHLFVSRPTAFPGALVEHSPEITAAKDIKIAADRLVDETLSDVPLIEFWDTYFTLFTSKNNVPEKQEEKNAESVASHPNAASATDFSFVEEQSYHAPLAAEPAEQRNRKPSEEEDAALLTIAEGIASLTREIYELRRLIESGRRQSSEVAFRPRQKVELDFEEFLTGRFK
ncbi:MAG: hypothetical protein R6U50_14020 [Desulfobacterales bacterium]